MYDNIVVGGGIVGSSVAYHLAQAGEQTLLLDRRDEGRATTASAGIISAVPSTNTNEDWFTFSQAAASYYPELIETLENQQDSDTGYNEFPFLKMAVSKEEVSEFDEWRETLQTRRESTNEGVIPAVTDLAPETVTKRWPGLAVPRRAALFESAARVNGQEMAATLRRAAGGSLTVVQEDAQDINIENGTVRGVATDKNHYETSTLVIAGGAWSSTFADQLGVSIPITPQRGQIVHLDTESMATDSLPIISAFRGHYMVPWNDNRIIAGATRESGTGFKPVLTVAGVQEVLAEATRIAPMFGGATINEFRVGLRPTSKDGFPILGALPDIGGAYVATGHGAGGLQRGPYSGLLVAQTVMGEQSGLDDSPFSATRFA